MKLTKYIFILFSLLAFVSCRPTVPTDATIVDIQADIYPDYYDVTIPSNIAPLNFTILTEGSDYVTHIHCGDEPGIVVESKTVDIDVDDWHRLLQANVGKTIHADVYVKDQDKWTLYRPVQWLVAEEIDPYVSYRLIEPSYASFEVMRICQRHLDDFEEDEIFNNYTFSAGDDGQCINCHVPQDYNRHGRWQMHVRIEKGGTVIGDSNTVKKVDLKRPGTISAGVYPAWHPTEPLVVYSNNTTMQLFHSLDPNKIEVQDAASNLILYDIDADKVTIIANDSTEWETFPAWSPDASYLYYVSATVPAMDPVALAWWKHNNYKDVKYNIYRRPYDAATKSFGAVDTVYLASEHNASATLPRISPDGRYLLFTQGEYGTFHIWHHDADLYLMDLTTGEVRPLTEANSDDTESYHTWSSNGRWIIFSSRRDDGSFTRLYIAYFDKDGNAHKAFMLPQRDPASNTRLMKSYNIPELLAVPNTASKHEIIKAIDK